MNRNDMVICINADDNEQLRLDAVYKVDMQYRVGVDIYLTLYDVGSGLLREANGLPVKVSASRFRLLNLEK